MTESQRRWYDQDPTLKEAMDILSLSPDNIKDQAVEIILKLQEEVAANVIERIYKTVMKYKNDGNRWYDNDPVMMKAIELLRVASPNIQKAAAKKLLKSFSQDYLETIELDDAQQNE
ncbi:MAG: hypothetical protein V2B14_00720 [bacterium]